MFYENNPSPRGVEEFETLTIPEDFSPLKRLLKSEIM
jgi:hypothetical protein